MTNEEAARFEEIMLEFHAKLKRLAEDHRYSSEFIGIVVRNHFSASGGVPAPAEELTSDPVSVGSAPGAEAENLTPAGEIGPPEGPTFMCIDGRHNDCGGCYREHGNGQFVVCPCVCHSGIPEPLLLGVARPQFSAETLDRLATEWNLCCLCGTITAETTWTYWHRPLEEEETPGAFDEWVPARPGEGDPMCLCPTCGWQHQDTDDGSGFYSGTWQEMSVQRRVDHPSQGESWHQHLVDVWKGEA